MIGLVARIRKPGCQADYMPVLEGPQGAKKSTACRILAGDEYFSDHLPDIQHKDASLHLRGKWLIEVSEMSAMSKADSARLKSYITRRYEKYRPPFGRKEVDEPRQCLFIGTTNESTYLRDETGARRFWCVKTGDIDIEALKRDRDQLFAEAVARYERGEPWWPESEFEAEFIKPEQDARYEVDPWEDPIRQYVDDPFLIEKVTVLGIGTWVLDLRRPQMGTATTRRITGILRRLGYKEARINKLRFWEPK